MPRKKKEKVIEEVAVPKGRVLKSSVRSMVYNEKKNKWEVKWEKSSEEGA